MQLFQRPVPCLFCNKEIIDVNGTHLLACKSNGDISSRHYQVVKALGELGDLAKLNYYMETKDLDPESGLRPADILFPALRYAVDVTISHPLAKKNLKKAAVTRGHSASSAELEKFKKNRAICAAQNLICSPFALETFGHFGDEA